jgi:hypothetical protein
MINQSQIIELEESFWKAMRNDDVDAAVSLTRFPCLISGPQGSRLVVEDDFREMMKAHSGKEFEGVELKNTLVEILNEETAVITYEYSLQGKTFLDASTWVLVNGNWVCGFHSETQKTQ